MMLLKRLQNLEHLGRHNIFLIMGCTHNDLNLDVTNILVESIGTMESDWHDRVESAKSQ